MVIGDQEPGVVAILPRTSFFTRPMALRSGHQDPVGVPLLRAAQNV